MLEVFIWGTIIPQICLPSCDYCGVLIDIIHDVQKQANTWCSEGDFHSVLKQEDENNTKRAKRNKIAYFHYKTNQVERKAEQRVEKRQNDNESFQKP